MEDIDAILESYNESDVINILGVDMVQKVAGDGIMPRRRRRRAIRPLA